LAKTSVARKEIADKIKAFSEMMDA
jgi:hypothetical protein